MGVIGERSSEAARGLNRSARARLVQHTQAVLPDCSLLQACEAHAVPHESAMLSSHALGLCINVRSLRAEDRTGRVAGET